MNKKTEHETLNAPSFVGFTVFDPKDEAGIKNAGGDIECICSLTQNESDPVEWILLSWQCLLIGLHKSGLFSTIAIDDTEYGTLQECINLLQTRLDLKV